MQTSRAHSLFKWLSVVLPALLLAFRAAASVDLGSTPATEADRKRVLQEKYFEAEKSQQEKLKIGRERYEKKMEVRAKTIQALNARLQAQQQSFTYTPVVRPNLEKNNNEETSALHTVILLVVAAIVAALYFYRGKPTPITAAPRPSTAAPSQSRYKIG